MMKFHSTNVEGRKESDDDEVDSLLDTVSEMTQSGLAPYSFGHGSIATTGLKTMASDEIQVRQRCLKPCFILL